MNRFGSGLQKTFLLFSAVICLVAALPPLSPEQIKLRTEVYEEYLAQNLSYDCFRYSYRNEVAPCDCLACLKTQPDFLGKMCRFRERQETIQNDGEKPKYDEGNIWHKICNPKCANKLPNKCCSLESRTPEITKDGCVACLPVKDVLGKHPSCFVAEFQETRKNDHLTWQQKYDIYMGAMNKSGLSPLCISYTVAKIASKCDCEPCLRSERTTKELREKMCRMAQNIRNNAELDRPAYWASNDYFKNFCDFNKCPDMPMQCCKTTGLDNSYQIDSKGCPHCLPTSELFGFGPSCESKFSELPKTITQRLSKLSFKP